MPPIVTVLGLGKLGAPMAAAFAARGFEVFGVDCDPQRVLRFRAGGCPVEENGLVELLARHGQQIEWTSDTVYAVAQSDLTFVIVPTPSESDGAFSSSFVLRALDEVGQGLKAAGRYHTVVVTSTVMPGTMRQCQRLLEHVSGLRMGEGFGLCYSPEFIALGSVIDNFLHPDFVLIGAEDLESYVALDNCYLRLFQEEAGMLRVPRAHCNFVNAEVAKIALNSYLTLKMSYANSLADLTERLPGGDIDQVLYVLGLDRRIGARYLKAGTPYGGPCLPRDGRALRAVARQVDVCLTLPPAVDEINMHLLRKLLDEVTGRNLGRDTAIAVLGLTYKPGTPVDEEAAGMKLVQMLVARGYTRVFVHDPYKAPACLSEILEEARVVYYLVPQEAYAGLESLVRPGALLIDPWRALEKGLLPERCHHVAYGVGPDDDNS